MKTTIFIDVIFLLSVFIVICIGLSEADKARRAVNSPSSLFSYPRVGRSDPKLSKTQHDPDGMLDNFYSASLENYEEFPQTLLGQENAARDEVTKLQKLAHMLALRQALYKRSGPSTTSGLWFGPRLGKRSLLEEALMHRAEESGQKELF